MTKYIFLVGIIILGNLSHATPGFMTYQGRLFDESGDPIDAGISELKVKLMSPDGECLLREEVHNLNMDSSGGFFSISLGNGAPSTDSPNYTLSQAISNTHTFTDALLSCTGNSYTPGDNDTRVLRVTVNGEDLTPDQIISAVPYSRIAATLQGKSLIEIETAYSDHADNNLAGSPLPDLQTTPLNAGESFRWSGTQWEVFSPGSADLADNSVTLDDVSFASTDGVNVPQLATDPASPTAGQIYYNTTSNKMMVYNGTSWVETGAAAGPWAISGADISYVAGNVGVGTTAPSALLHIEDSGSTGTPGLRIVGSGTQVVATLGDSNSGSGLESGSFRLFHEGSENVKLSSASDSYILGGNLGIGTATPSSDMSIHSSGVTKLGIGTEGSGAADQAIINIMTRSDGANGLNHANTKGWHIYSRGDAYGTTVEQNDLGFRFYNGTSSTDSLYLDSITGNVGVGTTSPAFRLDVAGSSVFRTVSSQIRIKETDAPDPEDGWHLSVNGGKLGFIHEDNSAGPSYNHAMYIDTTGNVGVGTTTPEEKLHISSGDITIDNNQFYRAKMTSGTSLQILGLNTSNETIFQNTNGQDIRVNPAHSGDILLANGGGTVGIGTTNPLEKLDIAGNVTISGNDTGVLRFRNASNSDHSSLGILNGGLSLSGLTDATTSSHVFIDNSGNVGVGTTSPQMKVHIHQSDITDGFLLENTESTAARYPSVSVRNYRGSTDTDGYPAFHLHAIRGSAGSASPVQDGDSLGQLQFWGSNDTVGTRNRGAIINAIARETFDTSSGATDLTFHTTPSGASDATIYERMRISSTGNIGIGTTTPLAPLSIGTYLHFGEGGGAVASGSDIRFDASGLLTAGADFLINFDGDNNSTNNAFIVGIDSESSSSTELFRIQENGNVGIGTSAPTVPLHIVGGTDVTLSSSGYLLIGDETGGNIVMDTNEIVARNNGAGSTLYIQGSASDGDTVISSANGRLGIGDSTPSYKLDLSASSSTYVARFVNSDSSAGTDGIIVQTGLNTNPGTDSHFVRFRDGDGSDIGSIRGSGTGGVSYATTSDRRLKKHIRDTKYSVEDLMKVRVRDYSYKSSDQTVTGFVAQELFEVFPTAVSRPVDESKDYWSVDYGQMTPFLTQGIQQTYAMCIENQERNQQDLKARDRSIEALEERNKELEARIERLESIVAEFSKKQINGL